MQVLTERLRALIPGAGYGSLEPVIAGVHGPGRPPVFAAQGMTGAGEPEQPCRPPSGLARQLGRTQGGCGSRPAPAWLAEDVEGCAVAERRHAFGRYPVPVVDEALGDGDPLEDGQAVRRARLVAADD